MRSGLSMVRFVRAALVPFVSLVKKEIAESRLFFELIEPSCLAAFRAVLRDSSSSASAICAAVMSPTMN